MLINYVLISGFIWREKHNSSKRDQRDWAGTAWADAWHLAQCVPLPGHCGDLLSAPCDHHHQLPPDILHHHHVSTSRNARYKHQDELICQSCSTAFQMQSDKVFVVLNDRKSQVLFERFASLENLSFHLSEPLELPTHLNGRFYFIISPSLISLLQDMLGVIKNMKWLLFSKA